MKCVKLLLITLMSLGASLGFATTANAGYYSTENGVRIYRSGPTPAQKSILQARRNATIAHNTRIARHQAAFTAQQVQATQDAYKNGFADGHQQGYQQARDEQGTHTKHKRRRYGRRYSTSLYGGRNGAYARYSRHRRRQSRP